MNQRLYFSLSTSHVRIRTQIKIKYYLTVFIIILRHYHINLSFRQLMKTKFNSLHAHRATVCDDGDGVCTRVCILTRECVCVYIHRSVICIRFGRTQCPCKLEIYCVSEYG